MKIRNLLAVSDSDMQPFDRPHFSGSVLDLSKMFGAQKLGFHLEVMNPGQFSAPFHSHEEEEEMFFVIEGEAIVRSEGQFRKVGPGDFIFYPTGQAYAHNMYNHSDKPFKFLALANTSKNDVCHYPDSRKVYGENGVTQDGKPADYWKDEEEPAKYWPEHVLRGDI